MSVADLFSGSYQGTPAPYTPTSLLDVADATFEDATRSNWPTGYFRQYANDAPNFDERNALIKSRFGRDIVGEVRKDNPEAGADYIMQEYQARTDALIDQGRQTNPEAWQGIRKQEEIEAIPIDKAQVARVAQEDVSSRAEDNWARYGGQLLGGAAAAFVDPINLATLPLGAGAGAGVLRGALIDGAVNMGVEAAEAPLTAEWQKKLGYKYGLGQMAADIATAGIGGTALSGIIRGAAHGLGKLTGKSSEILDRIAKDPQAPSEVKDAAQYMNRVAQIDEGAPPVKVDVPEGEAVAANRANMQETQDALRNYREPAYREDIPFNIESPKPEASAPAAPRNFEYGQLEGGKFTGYTVPNSRELPWVESAVADLKDAYKRERILSEPADTGRGGDVNVTGYKGNFPNWFKDIAASEHIGREYVDKVFEKMKTGEPLGKKEARVAESLFAQGKAMREENVRQIQSVREGKQQDVHAEIDATAAREAALEARDPYLDQHADPAKTLADEVKTLDSPDWLNGSRADFERIVKEQPEMTIAMPDGSTVSFKELAGQIAEDEKILNAIRTCAAGL